MDVSKVPDKLNSTGITIGSNRNSSSIDDIDGAATGYSRNRCGTD